MNRKTAAQERQHRHEVAVYAARLRWNDPKTVRARTRQRNALRAQLAAIKKEATI